MQVAAKLKYARISPQKCRLVADMVRGKPVGQALSTLRFTPKKGAEARAQGARVGDRQRREQPQRGHRRAQGRQHPRSTRRRRLKRFHARAKGRGNRIVKRNSHITILVGDGRKG